MEEVEKFNKSGKVESSFITNLGLMVAVGGLILSFIASELIIGIALFIIGLALGYFAYYEIWKDCKEYEGRHIPIGNMGIITVGKGKKFRVSTKGGTKYLYFGFDDKLRVKYDTTLSKQYIETGRVLVKNRMYAKINVLHTYRREN